MSDTNVNDDWQKFVKEQEEIDLKSLIEEENLNEEETKKFINNSFRDGQVKTNGTDIERILPLMRKFGGGNRTEKKRTIIEKVLKFFEKYFEVNSSTGDNIGIIYKTKDENKQNLEKVVEESKDYNNE